MVHDALLLDSALITGMRRGELADLEPKDIHADFLIAHGKGGKERVLPLGAPIAQRLHNFIKGMKDLCQGIYMIPIGWEKRVPAVLDAAGL